MSVLFHIFFVCLTGILRRLCSWLKKLKCILQWHQTNKTKKKIQTCKLCEYYVKFGVVTHCCPSEKMTRHFALFLLVWYGKFVINFVALIWQICRSFRHWCFFLRLSWVWYTKNNDRQLMVWLINTIEETLL